MTKLPRPTYLLFISLSLFLACSLATSPSPTAGSPPSSTPAPAGADAPAPVTPAPVTPTPAPTNATTPAPTNAATPAPPTPAPTPAPTNATTTPSPTNAATTPAPTNATATPSPTDAATPAPTTAATPAPTLAPIPLPEIAPNFQTYVQASFTKLGFTLSFTEYYSTTQQAIRYEGLFNNTHIANIYNYNKGHHYILFLDNMDCIVWDNLGSEFGNGNSMPSTSTMFQFGPEFEEVYQGTSLVRGYEVNHWTAKFVNASSPTPYDYTAHYYFTIKADDNGYHAPVRVTVAGTATSDEGVSHEFSHDYDWVGFETHPLDAALFSPPTGETCTPTTQENVMAHRPKLPTASAVEPVSSTAPTLPFSNVNTFSLVSEVVANYNGFVLRDVYDQAFDYDRNTMSIEASGFSGDYSVLLRYDQGVSYFVGSNGKCYASALSDSANGFVSDHMHVKSLGELIQPEKYVYAGRETKRGVVSNKFTAVISDQKVRDLTISSVNTLWVAAPGWTYFGTEGSSNHWVSLDSKGTFTNASGTYPFTQHQDFVSFSPHTPPASRFAQPAGCMGVSFKAVCVSTGADAAAPSVVVNMVEHIADNAQGINTNIDATFTNLPPSKEFVLVVMPFGDPAMTNTPTKGPASIDLGTVTSLGDGTATYSSVMSTVALYGNTSVVGRMLSLDLGDGASLGCVVGIANNGETHNFAHALRDTTDGVAVAFLQPIKGSGVTGHVVFASQPDGNVLVTPSVSGLAPNSVHAIHVHLYGDISNENGTAAGPHFQELSDPNPHGLPTTDDRHLGDMGNWEFDADGFCCSVGRSFNLMSTSGFLSVVGHSVIVHAGEDKGAAYQPSGDAGARIAQGVIGARSFEFAPERPAPTSAPTPAPTSAPAANSGGDGNTDGPSEEGTPTWVIIVIVVVVVVVLVTASVFVARRRANHNRRSLGSLDGRDDL